MKLASIRKPAFKPTSSGISRLRRTVFFLSLVVLFSAIIIRLGYWQIIKGNELYLKAEAQYQSKQVLSGSRGNIFFQDGKPLVLNQELFQFYVHPNQLDAEDKEKILLALIDFHSSRSNESNPDLSQQIEFYRNTLNQDSKKWVVLEKGLSKEEKKVLEAKELDHTGFESYQERLYPEASMAAHLTGFLGKDEQGSPKGYFGLEGALNTELEARKVSRSILKDALGYSLSPQAENINLDGRSFTTTIRRDIQHLLEKKLAQAELQYGFAVGEIIVTNPSTGEIMGLATFPKYNQTNYAETDPVLYANPSLSQLYEPGSTFKVLTVAAGIDSQVITPTSTCDRCAGPRVFGKYTIKTWNEEYHPNITMQDALAKSDNIAMIYVAERVGAERMQEYFKKFGIGEPLNLELEEDRSTPFPTSFRPVELATMSFGQGISTSSLQLVRAVSAIANEGVMMQSRILKSIYDPITESELEVPSTEVRRVVSAETARQVAGMMVHAAREGEAKWAYRPRHSVAGKTGTSQVANKGGYDEDTTIASFIGFAPAEKPAFVMLVKLTAPQSSIWAAETAAPLWYDIAEELYLLLKVAPDR